MRHRRRRIAAVLILAIGVLHAVLAPEYLDEQAYVGVLFILTAIGAAVVAPWLWFRGGRLPWLIGALIAACTFVGFVASRTVGLPAFKETDWELSGIVSLVLEAAVFVLWVHRERHALARAATSVVPHVESDQRRDPHYSR
jgi:Na+/proline symporter